MVFETQIPEASKLVSSVTLERQILNQGKIVSQNQMVWTQNVDLKHLHLHGLWGTSLAKTLQGSPKLLGLVATSTHLQTNEYPLECNSHRHDNLPLPHVGQTEGLVGISVGIPWLWLGGKQGHLYHALPPIFLFLLWDRALLGHALKHVGCLIIKTSQVKLIDVVSDPPTMSIYNK